MKALVTLGLLTISNIFMTLAWYGHLQLKQMPAFAKLGLFSIVIISWGIAFFEYIFQVPANRIGYEGYGGPFTQYQLKTIQEAISLLVFVGIVTFVFKAEKPGWNHLLAFVLIVVAVFLVFKK